MKQISIPPRIIEELKTQARNEAPKECCGLLSGRDSVVTARHSLRNDSQTPERSYFAAPEELFLAMRQIRNAGESLLAIYHSHPSSSAYPSPTDIAMAFYPDVVYLVLSLIPEAELRGFEIRNGVVEDVELVVLEK